MVLTEMEKTEVNNISKAVTSGNADPQESVLSKNQAPEGENDQDTDNVFAHENEDGEQAGEAEKTSKSLEHNDINPSKCEGCLRLIKTARFQVYLSHFLSSWGDRMWMFAAGLFLMEVTPGSLRLAAIYGAALGLTVIILGAPVGRLVDRTSRLRMAQVSLCIQNLMVCLCAVILVFMTTQRSIFEAWDGWALTVAEILVIVTACIAQIGTLGSKLSIEKDWIIVICGQDKGRLANMNSVLRSLDLSTQLIAPVIVGTIMTSVGNAAGGIVIASWNIGSLVVEYGLLHHLFYSSEDLQKPKASVQLDSVANRAEGGDGNVDDSGDCSRWQALKTRIIAAWSAWILYMQHPIRDAGLGLSFLYMTVIAFDNYSRGFVFESGVPESVLGVLTAVASGFGIIGSLLYPRVRVKIGITKTGLVGFCAETFCLLFCVASVFAPGSPFDASALIYGSEVDMQLKEVPSATPTILYDPVVMSEVANTSVLIYERNITEVAQDKKSTEVVNDFTSVSLLLIGIITSRTGLWIADLSITQILQEQVDEGDRGAINGVQSSLNQFFGLMRSILLIILPTRATFGFLIILSFLFVSLGWALYGVYARREMSKAAIKSTESEEQHEEECV